MAGLSWGDVVVVVASLVGVIGMAMYSSKKGKKDAPRGNAEQFFLAGRSMPWWICAASLFASNIGTEHFVGQAGAAASGGIAVGLYEWSAAYLLILLGWIFAPVYIKCQLSTIPEYLEGRYNRICRVLFVLMTMMAYVLSKIGASVYAGAVLLEVVTGFSMWASAPLVIVGTALYTAVGGLSVVMITDTVQMVIFLFGGLLGTGLSLRLVGGLSGLFQILEGRNLGYMTHMVRSVNDRDYPWPGMLLGMPITSVWYWCIDQEMAQRVLSARSLEDAQIGTAVAAFLKIVPVFITVVPGMVARALYEQCTQYGTFPEWCIDADEDLSNDNVANRAYPLLVLREFPVGVKGIMVASFLAAMMSSLSSVYNSASTILTYDVYQRFWYPQGGAPAARLVQVGQCTTIALTILTFSWLPIINTSDKGLYLIAQAAMTHLAPPVVAIFILGLFWRRANAQGATAGFISGAVLGIIRWTVTLFSENLCEKTVVESTTGKIQNLTASTWFPCLNFNYFAIILFSITVLIVVIVSLMTPPPSDAQLRGRMFGNLATQGRMEPIPPSSPQSTRNAGTLSYNPFADATGGGEDANSQLDRETGGNDVSSSTLDGLELKVIQEQGRVQKYGRVVANILGISVMLTIGGLIVIFH